LKLLSYSDPALDLISAGTFDEKLLTESNAAADLNSTEPVGLKQSAPTMNYIETMLPRTWTKSTTSALTAAKRLFTESGVHRATAAIVL